MNWPMWLATVEEATRLLDHVSQELTDVEDEAADALSEVVAVLGADDGVIDLLRQRVDEQVELDAELARADAAEYEASLVPDEDEDPGDEEEVL